MWKKNYRAEYDRLAVLYVCCTMTVSSFGGDNIGNLRLPFSGVWGLPDRVGFWVNYCNMKRPWQARAGTN